MGFIPDLDACRFACVSHVTGTMEPENSVIYNPILSMERNICIIRDITKTRFGVKLTKKELLHLVTYKSTEIKEFVDELRSLIRKHKEAEQKKEK